MSLHSRPVTAGPPQILADMMEISHGWQYSELFSKTHSELTAPAERSGDDRRRQDEAKVSLEWYETPHTICAVPTTSVHP